MVKSAIVLIETTGSATGLVSVGPSRKDSSKYALIHAPNTNQSIQYRIAIKKTVSLLVGVVMGLTNKLLFLSAEEILQ